ncbi:MAG: hypothetical protein CR964_00935 [Rhodobacterales bacterium]|nr:MAG: hypothetical protein CR964_00935 [Rhodobacterales bacterium]
MVLLHPSPVKDSNHFWLYGVEQKYRDGFGERPGSARFIALMPRLFAPFCGLMHSLSGAPTGMYSQTAIS